MIPAAALLLIALLFFVSMSVPDFRGLIPFDLLRIGVPFVVVGGATAVAVAQITFTTVLVIIGRRARRIAASIPAAEYGAYPVGQYPPAPPAAYPPAPRPSDPGALSSARASVALGALARREYIRTTNPAIASCARTRVVQVY